MVAVLIALIETSFTSSLSPPPPLVASDHGYGMGGGIINIIFTTEYRPPATLALYLAQKTDFILFFFGAA